jgi:choline dehydrogenase
VYDYVIVGAGSAGCVLANRLSEDPDVEVLVIEAGGRDDSELIHMPAAAPALMRTDKDWDYSSGYEPHCNDRRTYLPRGRVLGGTSSVNWMVYIRGNRLDYDEWRDLGCAGWGWEDMLPYFKRAEDNERGASELHGAGGPLAVSEGRSRNPIAQAFIDAGVAHGLPVNDDFNGREQDGVGWYQVTQRDGLRGSTAACYLRPAMERPNLHVETHIQVLRIVFDGTRAVGVHGQRLGELLEFGASREVIVSCGAYNSPQLLMLSGIGRPIELAQLQIAPVAELPGVGQNLSDHPLVAVNYLASREDSLFGAMNVHNLALFESARQGPLTSNGVESGGFVRARSGLDAPDVQLHCVRDLDASPHGCRGGGMAPRGPRRVIPRPRGPEAGARAGRSGRRARSSPRASALRDTREPGIGPRPPRLRRPRQWCGDRQRARPRARARGGHERKRVRAAHPPRARRARTPARR